MKVGQIFNCKEEFKATLFSLSMENFYEMRLKRSDKSNYDVECVEDKCTFVCRGSLYQKMSLFMVRQYVADHTCGMGVNHNHHKGAASRLIAEKVLHKFLNSRKCLRASEIQDFMLEHGIRTSYYKANRARLFAHDMAHGTLEDSYTTMYSYMHMLEKSNPGTYTRIVRDADQRFKYVFWTLGPWIRAAPHLKKVISVDDTHLTAMFKGILLLATAQDGNSQIYLLAVAVVNSENDDAWSFFFSDLRVVVPDHPELYFVSDRHVSIGKALRNSYHFAKHVYCIYHIYQNFKRKFGRQDLFGIFKKAAQAYTIAEFNHQFAQITTASPKIGQYIKEAGVKNWARVHFHGNRFNIMTSNNAECLNGLWKTQRQWPILALFDAILETISKSFCERRETASKWDQYWSPFVYTLVEVNYRRSTKMSVRRLSQFEAEVMQGTMRYSVNLNARTCDCNMFQIDKVPCAHAIAVASDRGVRLTDLVHPMFKNDCVREVYKETVHLVPPTSRWSVPEAVSSIRCYAPKVKRPPERPRINRYRATWERNYSRKRRCSYCGNLGHNKQYCRRRRTDEGL